MQTHSATKQKRKRTRDETWEKIKNATGLYRYRSSGTFYANVRRSGKLFTESLRTRDIATAKRLLRDTAGGYSWGRGFMDWLDGLHNHNACLLRTIICLQARI